MPCCSVVCSTRGEVLSPEFCPSYSTVSAVLGPDSPLFVIQLRCGSSSSVHFFSVSVLTASKFHQLHLGLCYIQLQHCVLFYCVLFHFLLFLLATVCAIRLLLPFKIKVHAATGCVYDAIISSTTSPRQTTSVSCNFST